MNEILARCNVNRTRYLRGLVVGCLDCVVVFPVGPIYLISDAKLLSTHFLPDSSTVPAGWGSSSIAAAVWRSNFWSRLNVTASMWTNAVLAFVFFALFGLTTEARTTYRNMFMTLVRLIWNRTEAIRTPPPTNSNAFELESKVEKDMTVSPSCASMQGSVSFKEGPIEVQTKRVSRISAAEMDAARFAGSMDDVASLPGERGFEFSGVVAAMV
ncbi:hypothetical protein OF83DRAFT_338475 [Amylostereum chailletii]|nr:hypothetical protein OF83DRAFT_338475 [Amylostereum chailletii]